MCDKKKKKTQAACAAGVVTGTAGRDSSRYRCHRSAELKDTPARQLALNSKIPLLRHTACMYEKNGKYVKVEVWWVNVIRLSLDK